MVKDGESVKAIPASARATLKLALRSTGGRRVTLHLTFTTRRSSIAAGAGRARSTRCLSLFAAFLGVKNALKKGIEQKDKEHGSIPAFPTFRSLLALNLAGLNNSGLLESLLVRRSYIGKKTALRPNCAG